MPSKGGSEHKKLKILAVQKAVKEWDIDEIKRIFIEPRKSRWLSENLEVIVNLYNIKTERKFFPDVIFTYPSEKKEKERKIIVIECECRSNSQLLSGGLRRKGYELLKEEHGGMLHLVLAKWKGIEMKNTDLFDEIWEFEK